MVKKTLSLLIVGIIVGMLFVSFIPMSVMGMTGSGTAENPYMIYNVTDLQNMNLHLAAYYELASDVDASATSGWNGGLGFAPVGTSVTPFTGSLDGNGYTVSGLYINRPGVNDVALFGETDGNSTQNVVIQNLNLVNVNITGKQPAGIVHDAFDTDITSCSVSGTIVSTSSAGMIACGYYGRYGTATMSNCHSSGTVTSSSSSGSSVGGISAGGDNANYINCYSTASVTGGSATGGIIGWSGTGNFTNCYSTGDVVADGNQGVGGIFGVCDTSTVSNCYATGHVTATGNWGYVGGFAGVIEDAITSRCFSIGNVTSSNTGNEAGGFVGYIKSNTQLGNCYSKGDISVSENVSSEAGGLVGDVYGSGISIFNCYSIGKVSKTGSYIGGTIGYRGAGISITSLFWDTDISGMLNGVGSGNETGVVGANTAQMKTKSTFTNAGWLFSPESETPIWAISEYCNDGYPYICQFCYLEWMCTGGCGPAWDPEGDYDDATPLNGCSVEDNNSTWVITVPYFNYYKELVNGSIEVRYQPTTMINSPLLDMSGNGKDGVINWGMSIGDIDVGGILPYSAFTPTGTETIPTVIPDAGDIPTDETSGATGEGLPLYYSFKKAADSLGWSLPVTYTLMFIIVAIVVGVAGLVAMGTGWGFSIGFGATMVLFGQVRDGGGIVIVPGFILIFSILVAIFLGYIWRYT